MNIVSRPLSSKVRLDREHFSPTSAYLVVLEYRKLDLLPLVFDFFGCGIIFLLSLLTTTPQPEHEVKRRFLLNVVVRKSSTIFELLTGEDQPLLVRRNTW